MTQAVDAHRRPRRRMTLAASIVGTGTSARSARWPGTDPHRFADFDHYRRCAEIARRGVLDAVFVSDHPAHTRDATRGPAHVLDPLVLFSAIAGAVPDIGFVLTASTSYNSPYNLARRAASLDAVSGGRTILNLVTSFNPDISANFGADPLLPRAERYRRADEFVRVLKDLWGSWDLGDGPPDDGPLWDVASSGPIDHHGEFFDVRGPLTVPVGPQGHPVISQAGASGPGLDFAAAHAEIVYAATLSKELAVRFRADLEQRVVRQGRSVDDVRLFPGVNVVLGDTEDDARRRQEAFAATTDEDALVRSFLAGQRALGRPALPLHVDPDVRLDPAWFEPAPEQNMPIGFSRAIQDLIELEGLTARQLVRRYGDPGGHRLVVGSPRQVADALVDWWADGVVDGWNVHLPLLPHDLERFVDEVVPLLQADGVLPRDYEESGATIRDRFGLAAPPSARLSDAVRATSA